MEDKAPELEEISWEDRNKIFEILYNNYGLTHFCKKKFIAFSDSTDIFNKLHIPTHKIKVNA